MSKTFVSVTFLKAKIGYFLCIKPMLKRLAIHAWPLLVLVFYVSTLAPTVLWGDDAFFQRSAFDGTLPRDGGGHWLWFVFAQAIIRIPFSEVAYKVNLLSALAGFATIVGLYWSAKIAGLSQSASLIVASCIAVAHTFWMHSVRAEVYTVFTMCSMLEIALLFNWMTKKSLWALFTALLLFGLTLLSHQMSVLLLPAIGYSIWLGRHELSRAYRFLALASFLLGLLPALAVVHIQIGQSSPTQSFILYFTHSGIDFRGALFDFSFRELPHDIIIWLSYLILQFPSPAIFLGLYGIATVHEWIYQNHWKFVVVVYLTGVVFAFSYRVNDQYVFYLPSYIAFAFVAGIGWDTAARRFPLLKQCFISRLVWGLVVVLPPLICFGLVSAFTRLDINPLQIRTLPGREPNSFFLWPAKNDYWGAYNYGSALLTSLPPKSVLIADHTPFQTLKYLQVVHKLGLDIELVPIEPRDELMDVIQSFPLTVPIFVADNDPRYYNLDSLAGTRLVKQGHAYRVIRMSG